MGNLLNPNYLNIPEQVEANTRKLEGSKIYRTTLNLTSGTSSIPIETTNIDDIKKVIEDSVIFSANGLMFLIKAFTTNSVLVEFYADLSSVNYLITKFDFETEEIIYQDNSAEFKGTITYADDELTGEKNAPANIKLKIKGGNQITIDVDESNSMLIIKIDEEFLTQLEEIIELSSENAQQLKRCLKTPISAPSSKQVVIINTANAQELISVDDLLNQVSEDIWEGSIIGESTLNNIDLSNYKHAILMFELYGVVNISGIINVDSTKPQYCWMNSDKSNDNGLTMIRVEIVYNKTNQSLAFSTNYFPQIGSIVSNHSNMKMVKITGVK